MGIHENDLREYFRSSHRNRSVKKLFLRTYQNSQENTFVRVPFLIMLMASVSNFIKKESLAQVFPVNFAKSLRTSFLQNTSGRLIFTVVWPEKIFNLLMLYAYQRCDFMLLNTFLSVKNKHSWQIMKANVELNDCLT